MGNAGRKEDRITSTETQSEARRSWLNAVILSAAFLAAANVVLTLVLDVRGGGHDFMQGDWLINMENGPIRRGPLGSVLIYISDITGLHLLNVLFLVQLSLFCVVFVFTMMVVIRLQNYFIYGLILLSPGFFIVFWGAYPEGGLRKELIAYAAFGLLLGALMNRRFADALTAGSIAVFLASLTGHELNTLLIPAYTATLAIVLSDRGVDRRIIASTIAVIFLAGLVAGVLALVHSRVDSVTSVCDPLLARGLQAQICDGAITWLDKDLSYALLLTREMFSSGFLLAFLFEYLIVAPPVLYLIHLHSARKTMTLVFFASAVPLLPLYVVAVDWGRWMSLHIVSFSFLFLAAVLANRIKLVREADFRLVAATVLFSLIWAPRFDVGVFAGGLVKELGMDLALLLGLA